MRNVLNTLPDAHRHQMFFGRVRYPLNKQGFLSDEFDVRKEINVATIGCSNALGWGLAPEQRFSNLFCERVAETTGKTVANWNLSLAGKSNDYIARMVWYCEQSLTPDVYLLCFTGLARREYFDVTGRYIDYVPKNFPAIVKNSDPQNFEIHAHLHQLLSPYEDTLNFTKNYHSIRHLVRNRTWFYTLGCCTETSNIADSIRQIMQEKESIGYFEVMDKAQDGWHPGPKSNQALAEKFINKWQGSRAIKHP